MKRFSPIEFSNSHSHASIANHAHPSRSRGHAIGAAKSVWRASLKMCNISSRFTHFRLSGRETVKEKGNAQVPTAASCHFVCHLQA
ncbi:hypothetical protein [Paraburkholderia sp. 32]|uniref:hypothetical protein n=1 Tax=unclassified Paraburkholderia TaxID=2615204 RepID=UPI003D231DEB